MPEQNIPNAHSNNPMLSGIVNVINAMGKTVREVGHFSGDDDMGASVGPTGTVLQRDGYRPFDDTWWGMIVEKGPAGTADFTDGRYWVRAISFLQAPSARPEDPATVQFEPTTYAWWVIGFHMEELGLGTHTLKVGKLNTDGTLSKPGTLVHLKLVDALKAPASATDFSNAIFVFSCVSRAGMFPVIVKSNGGYDGTASAYATWTYDLYDLRDTGYVTKLNTAGSVGPQCSRARTLMAKVNKAADGSVATAYFDANGAIQIFECQETFSQSNCA